jgi:hypothetical protein
VDALELGVGEPGLDQRRQRIVRVDPAVQVGHRAGDFVGRGRYICSGAGAAATDPVLAAPDLAGQFVGAADAGHQDLVGLAEQACAERQAGGIGDEIPGAVEGGDIVADLLDIVGPIGFGSCFEPGDIAEGGLGAFDLGREDGLLAHEAIEEPLGVGDDRAGQGEACHGVLGGAESVGDGGQIERRVGWRQGRGDKGPDFFAVCLGDAMSAGLAGAWVGRVPFFAAESKKRMFLSQGR